jgi:mannose-6-phosphate isomerase-like protein (cupin superfamily)
VIAAAEIESQLKGEHLVKPTTTQSGKNYAVAQTGATHSWRQFTCVVGALPGLEVPGKAFLAEPLRMTGMEMSVNVMPPGSGMPFRHAHQRHEETYFFLSGQGQMQIDGDVVDVQPGSVVCIQPNGDRAWRNTGKEPLYYLVIQALADSLTQSTTEDGFLISRQVDWPQE